MTQYQLPFSFESQDSDELGPGRENSKKVFEKVQSLNAEIATVSIFEESCKDLDEFKKSKNSSFKPFSQSGKTFSIKQAWQSRPMETFELWMQSVLGGKGFKERSQVVYRSMWKKLIKYSRSDEASSGLGASPAFMDAAQIRSFLKAVQSRSSTLPSPTQQRRYLSLLSSVQQELVEQGCLSHNAALELIKEKPMQEVTFLRNLPVALLPEQERLVESWVFNQTRADPCRWRIHRDSALICMVLGSGVKLHELQSLRLCDVIIKYPESQGPAMVRIKTNGGKERRSPLTQTYERAVLSWMIWLREQGASELLPIFLSSEDDQAGSMDPALELDLADHLSLCQKFQGVQEGQEAAKPMSGAQIWRVVHQAFIDCGFSERLARHGPSVLRNTFATRQLRMGVSIDKVALWLGHKDKRSTEVYRSLLLEPGSLGVM